LGYAAALDFARLGAFTGVLTVLGNVVSLLQAEGVPLDEFVPALGFLSSGFLEGALRAMTADEYPSGSATLMTGRAWADQFVQSEHDVGIDPRVAELIRDCLALGIERGQGDDDIYALFSAFGRLSNYGRSKRSRVVELDQMNGAETVGPAGPRPARSRMSVSTRSRSSG